MYKILHVSSGEILSVPDSVNKEEADKLVRQLLRQHKQISDSRNTYVYYKYRKVLEKFTELYPCELETIFVSIKQTKYQIKHIDTNEYYDKLYLSKEDALISLTLALKRETYQEKLLRSWAIKFFAPPSDSTQIKFWSYSHPKANHVSKISNFDFIEV